MATPSAGPLPPPCRHPPILHRRVKQTQRRHARVAHKVRNSESGISHLKTRFYVYLQQCKLCLGHTTPTVEPILGAYVWHNSGGRHVSHVFPYNYRMKGDPANRKSHHCAHCLVRSSKLIQLRFMQLAYSSIEYRELQSRSRRIGPKDGPCKYTDFIKSNIGATSSVRSPPNVS